MSPILSSVAFASFLSAWSTRTSSLARQAPSWSAHKLVMHQRRAGGQSQHSEMLDLAPNSDRIQNALNYARQNLSRSLTVEELAETVHLSPRQFGRVFTLETGQSPAKAIEGLRLEAARLMIEQGRHPLDVIAKETGFRACCALAQGLPFIDPVLRHSAASISQARLRSLKRFC